jgi:tetratricopeptide (TPR) repeat protein
LLLTAFLALAFSLLTGRPAPPPAGKVLFVGTSTPWPDAGDPLGEDASSLPLQKSLAEWKALLPRLEEAAKKTPTDAAAQRRLAMAYFNLGRLDEAEAIYEKLLAGKEEAMVRNRLGNVYRAKGDLTQAEAAYRQAMKTDPALPAPYLNLAELFWRQHRDQDALAVVSDGLAKVPVESRPPLEQAEKAIETSAGSGTPADASSTATTHAAGTATGGSTSTTP